VLLRTPFVRKRVNGSPGPRLRRTAFTSSIAIAWQLAWNPVTVDAQPEESVARDGIRGDVVAGKGSAVARRADRREARYPPLGELRHSTTNLVLTGVLARDDPTKGLAIISRSAESAGAYAVGAALGSGVTLHAVFADGVILERDGILEALPLTRPAALGNASQLPSTTASKLAALADIVRPVPVFSNGVQRGYRFYPANDPQQFAALGLQHGDLVLAINGVALDDPQRGMDVLKSIGPPAGVVAAVERYGEGSDVTLGATAASSLDAGVRGP
jgi:type II secretion system protein C